MYYVSGTDIYVNSKNNLEKEVSYNPKSIDFKNWEISCQTLQEPGAEKMNSASLAFFFPNSSHLPLFLKIGLSLAPYL